MSDLEGQLDIPQGAALHPEAFEVLRLWVAGDQEQVSLRAGVWQDPGAWGPILADLARHAARAESQSGAGDEAELLARIVYGFESELALNGDDFPGETNGDETDDDGEAGSDGDGDTTYPQGD
jgi:hypothetical protein